MGLGYGPVVVSREPRTLASLAGKRVASACKGDGGKVRDRVSARTHVGVTGSDLKTPEGIETPRVTRSGGSANVNA